MQSRVSRFLDQLLCFHGEDLGWIGFVEEECGENLDEKIQDGCPPENPAPGRVLRDETAGDGTEGWTEERCETVDCDGFAALFSAPAVGYDASSYLFGSQLMSRRM